jgi:hypothetical protein
MIHPGEAKKIIDEKIGGRSALSVLNFEFLRSKKLKNGKSEQVRKRIQLKLASRYWNTMPIRR